MKRVVFCWIRQARKEILSHKTVYGLLFLILASAAFLRLFRLGELLGFYYDQGRDALVIYRLLHEGKLFLIGPVTGIEGIFLGPFYYYLITPFYFLGGGSPVFVAGCLSWLAVVGIGCLFVVGAKLFDRSTGLIAAVLYSFSYSLVVFDRWLSHPKLLPLFSLLTIWALYNIYQGRERFWLWLSLSVGLGLQLEAASAFFFLPAVLIFAFWQREKIKNRRLLVAAGAIFLATFLPQIAFNFRHQGILVASFKKFLLGESSFRFTFWQVVKVRLETYVDVLFSKLFYDKKQLSLIFLLIFAATGLWFWKRLFSSGAKILLLWLGVPLLGLLFYQGNFGRIWDYYFAGIYPIFILLIGALLSWLLASQWGRVISYVFLLLFFWVNLNLLRNYYQIGIGIQLRHQLAAIDWIYQDAHGQDFNIDVYVPPVIPHAYQYLFLWYGSKQYQRQPLEEKMSLLYTLYEADWPHPERLDDWLARQEGIGETVRSQKFGDITVERRERI